MEGTSMEDNISSASAGKPLEPELGTAQPQLVSYYNQCIFRNGTEEKQVKRERKETAPKNETK